MLSWELISPEEAIHFAKRRDSPFNAHLFLPLFVGFDSLILKVIKTVAILKSVWGGLPFRLSEEQNISWNCLFLSLHLQARAFFYINIWTF